MQTKEELVKTIKQWLKTDNEIHLLKRELKERNAKKNELSKALITTMKSHEINRFDITGGAKLIYQKQSSKKALNKKKLLELITNFYGDEATGAELSNFLYENREVVVKEKILHKVPGGGGSPPAAVAT